MKNRKHRIFIIGNFAKPQQGSTTQAQKEVKVETPPQKNREESKRRKLFKEVVIDRRESSKEQYTYQVKQHIQAEGLGGLFTCDLLGNKTQSPRESKQQQKVQQRAIKPQQRIAIEKVPHPIEQQPKPNQLLLRAQAAHNETFTGGLRRRIFQSATPPEFRSHSTLQGPKRRKIFFKYESPNNLSINTSISKERRRIFSLNPKSSQSPPSPYHILAPLQETIKEQEQRDISRITQVRNAIEDSRLRS